MKVEDLNDVENKKNEKEQDDDSYNPNKIPADLQLAQKHKKAKLIGVVTNFNTLDPDKDICPCCGNVIEKSQLNLTSDLRSLGFLGSGVPLYFFFLKFCLTFLILIGLISSIYNIMQNKKGSICNSLPNCEDSFATKYGVTNRDNPLDKMSATAGLNLLTTFCLIVGSMILRKQMKNLNKLIDIDNVTPSDFTVMISNMRKETTEKQILDYLHLKMKNSGELKIIKVVQAYDISYYTLKKRERQILANLQIQESKLLNKTGQQNSMKLNEIISKIKDIDQILEQKESLIEQDQFELCGVCFVTFGSDLTAENVTNKFKRNIFQAIGGYVFNYDSLQGRILNVIRAPEPTDIYWENLCYTSFDRAKRKTITYILSAIMITACFFAIYGINKAQASVSGGKKSAASQVLGFIISLCIFIINTGINIMIKKFALFELHDTLTNYYIAVALKSGIAQFLNTTIIVYIVKKIRWDHEIYAEGGLLGNLNFLVLMNFIFLFSYFWNPFYLIKLLKRRYLINKQSYRDSTPQYQAHEIIEPNKYDFSQSFAKIIKIMLFAVFYSYAAPLVIYASIFTIAVCYWVDKIYFLRMCGIPDMLSQDLPYAMADFFLELIIIIFNVGNMVFEKLLYDKVNGMTTFSLVISVIFWIFDFSSYTDCLFNFINNNNEIKHYDNYSYQFLTDYERANPITAMKAIEKWQKELKEKGGSKLRHQQTNILSNYALSRPGMNQMSYGIMMPRFGNFRGIMIPQQQMIGFNRQQVFPQQSQNQGMQPEIIKQEINNLEQQQQQLRNQMIQQQSPMIVMQLLNQLEKNKQRIIYLQNILQMRQQPSVNNTLAPTVINQSELPNSFLLPNQLKVAPSNLPNPLLTSNLGQIVQNNNLPNPLLIPNQGQILQNNLPNPLISHQQQQISNQIPPQQQQQSFTQVTQQQQMQMSQFPQHNSMYPVQNPVMLHQNPQHYQQQPQMYQQQPQMFQQLPQRYQQVPQMYQQNAGQQPNQMLQGIQAFNSQMNNRQ